MSYFCQQCDQEMQFPGSVVYINEYITCGKPKCKRWAKKMSGLILQEEKPVKKVDGIAPVMIVVYSTKTPLVSSSWKLVKPEDHPEFLSDPDVLAKMLDEGLQSKDSDDSETWYQVERTEDARERLERARSH